MLLRPKLAQLTLQKASRKTNRRKKPQDENKDTPHTHATTHTHTCIHTHTRIHTCTCTEKKKHRARHAPVGDWFPGCVEETTSLRRRAHCVVLTVLCRCWGVNGKMNINGMLPPTHKSPSTETRTQHRKGQCKQTPEEQRVTGLKEKKQNEPQASKQSKSCCQQKDRQPKIEIQTVSYHFNTKPSFLGKTKQQR